MNGKSFRNARKYGYRSGLELKVSKYLDDLHISYRYEDIKIEWEDLAYRTYTPDFLLDNNIIIEVKGRFIASDRRKHLAIKRQHPELDIRFIFENSKRKLYKGAKSTYAEWCIRHGFFYCDRIIPANWLKEKIKCTIRDFIPFKNKKRGIK